MIELKKCPFCGSDGELREYEDKKTGNLWYGVRCRNCNCIGNDIDPQYGNQQNAINAWNRREGDGHSFWVESAKGYKICHHCKADVAIFSGHRSYCPNCGAKMDG